MSNLEKFSYAQLIVIFGHLITYNIIDISIGSLVGNHISITTGYIVCLMFNKIKS